VAWDADPGISAVRGNGRGRTGNVSRELAAAESAVVTVRSLQEGTKENVIPEVILKINVRTYDERVRQRVLAAMKRIVQAEAAARVLRKNRRSNPSTATPLCGMIRMPRSA
jgi:metal-dependent amidase/aminoacylase/carboxypeptidase family protein